ncbi:MAG: ABC transporter ATP-binding protein, partial [Oscillochloris sp.]|nr:ABC transporter ATP-binding protein [Oscillochloris sp.]
MSMPAAIETINLTRRYGRALALDNLNLTVAQ